MKNCVNLNTSHKRKILKFGHGKNNSKLFRKERKRVRKEERERKEKERKRKKKERGPTRPA